MGYSPNVTYFIRSHRGTGRFLNRAGTGAIANVQNVNIYQFTNVNDEKWQVRTGVNGLHIVSMMNTAFALDLYTPNSNCDVYKLAGNEADSLFEFNCIDYAQNIYRIRSIRHNKFLTVDANANFQNAYWANYKEEDGQYWQFIVAEGYNGGPSVTLPTEVTVTGMPKNAGYTADTEYFHPDAGMVTGDWNSANNGATIVSNLREFFKKVYGNYPENLPGSKYLYSLYGGKYDLTAGPDFARKFHPGVDVKGPSNSTLYAARDGTVESVGSYYIKIKSGDKYLVYVHLIRNTSLAVGAQVTAGVTVIGQQSNQGPSTVPEHLHIEVHSNSALAPQPAINNIYESMSNTLKPYEYLIG